VKNRAFRIAGVVTACVLSVASSPATDEQVPSLTEVVSHDFHVRTLDDGTVALADLIASGRPVVIEFWATWCPPCRKTLPRLVQLKNEHGKDLVVLGLTVEDPNTDAGKVRAFVDEQNVNYPIAFAPDELFQFMNRRLDIAVPKLFIFDANGRLVSYIPRYSPLTPHKLKSAVREALSRGR